MFKAIPVWEKRKERGDTEQDLLSKKAKCSRSIGVDPGMHIYFMTSPIYT